MTALLATGCSTSVIGGNAGGAGGIGGAGGTGGTIDAPTDTTGTGGTTTGSTGSTGVITHQCTGWIGGSCSSTDHPDGETCFQCSCRCCDDAELTGACLADAACAAWLDCMRACPNGQPCGATCVLPCDTGSEPACYLMDCHNWVCAHACGESG